MARFMADPCALLEEGEVQEAVQLLRTALSVPEPDTCHVQLVADLGKGEKFREQAEQLIEPLLAILKQDPLPRETMQQVRLLTLGSGL